MSKNILSSFAWLWIAALLTATVGVNLQRIYCYCTDEARVVWGVAESAACADEAALPVCCEAQKTEQEACCADKAGQAPEKAPCTHTSSRFFHLKTEFLVEWALVKALDCPEWIQEHPLFQCFFDPVLCEKGSFQPASLPPPPGGRLLCIRHSVFLC